MSQTKDTKPEPMDLWKNLGVIGALFRANWRTHHAAPWYTLMLGFFMFAQNCVFFGLWVLFFDAVGQVRGWGLKEVSILFGLLASSVGLSLFFFDGCRTLAIRIQEGTLDGILTRPVSPLPILLFSRSNAASLGDIITGPLYWYFFGDLPFHTILGLFGLSILGAFLFTAVNVIFFSLPFFLKQKDGRLSDQLFEIMIILSTVPPHAQALGTKVLLFSLFPAGFIGYIPVLLFQHFSPLLFAADLLGIAFFIGLALWFFHAGVRRYKREMG